MIRDEHGEWPAWVWFGIATVAALYVIWVFGGGRF